MKRVLLQPAYVLHRRPYRETSFLVEALTKEFGRVSLLAKGVRKTNSFTAGLLQPFIPLLVSWCGKGELMILSQVEACGETTSLGGECLFAGFYLNELLLYLLQKWDAYPELYQVYEHTLSALRGSVLEEKILRSFEKYLLVALGYGLLHAFIPDQYYHFTPEQGFVVSNLGGVASKIANVFSGKNLLAIAHEDWHNEEILQDAKRLTRLILAPLLGARPIYSRKLFLKKKGTPRE